jgi:antitoxin VapB
MSTVSLNIKKETVHELARTAAARTGLSQTSVIEEALTMYLARLDDPTEAQERRRRAVMLLEQLDAELDDAARARLLDESDIYDDAGLPA